MWKQILTKINASLLANWSQLVWFILGSLLGLFVLGGLVGCRAIDGAKTSRSEVDGSVRSVPVLGPVYAIPSNVVQGVYGVAENAVVETVELVAPTVKGVYGVAEGAITETEGGTEED